MRNELLYLYFFKKKRNYKAENFTNKFSNIAVEEKFVFQCDEKKCREMFEEEKYHE